ncbi:MAG: tetratricopeptide repeat protein, partial [Rickettsiales bacterium]|nr:tetratricopeptide repeat protein [Rickettsiales bacterium]
MLQRKFEQALSLFQSGSLDAACDACEEVLKNDPKHFDSLYLLAISSCQRGDFVKAVELFKRVIAINSNNAVFYANLAMALMEVGMNEDAVAAYDAAILRDSQNASYYYNKGIILQSLKRFADAASSYDRAIKINPNDADFYYNRAIVFVELKELRLALNDYDEAIFLKSNNFQFYINRGNLLLDLTRVDEAIASYEKALALGVKDCAELYYNYGNALFKKNKFKEAITYYDNAISLNNDYVSAYNNRGNAFVELALLSASIDNYKKVLALDPSYKFLQGMLLYTKIKICDWDNYEESKDGIEKKVKNHELVSNPFSILSIYDSLQIHYLTAKISVAEDYKEGEAVVIPKRQRFSKIKLGYYSADFHNHATSYLMAEMFELHDRSKFEVIGFSFGPDLDDEMRRRV